MQILKALWGEIFICEALQMRHLVVDMHFPITLAGIQEILAHHSGPLADFSTETAISQSQYHQMLIERSRRIGMFAYPMTEVHL